MIENLLSSESVIVALYSISCVALAVALEKIIVLFGLNRTCSLYLLSVLIKDKSPEKIPARAANIPAMQFMQLLNAGENANIARQRIMDRLNKRIAWLGTISTIAPMLGLLGTVTGMIKSFQAFDHNSVETIQLISGIDEALLTTSLGLMIAIPSLIVYNWLAARANRFLDELDLIAESRPQNDHALKD